MTLALKPPGHLCAKLTRVYPSVKLLSRQTLDLLYKITVRSVIDYALPVYFKTLKQTEMSRLENLQYRAAKIVTGAYHYTSREKLNTELGWETIEKRADILGLNIFQKIHWIVFLKLWIVFLRLWIAF